MHTGRSNRLLKGDGVRSRDAPDTNVGVAQDSHTQRLVGKQPSVEDSQGLDVVDREELGDVDRLENVGGRGGELDLGEWSVGLVVLEVHDALKGVDVGVDGTIGLDGAAERHGKVLALRVGHDEAVEDEFGIIKLLLGDLGNADQEADGVVSIRRMVGTARRRNLSLTPQAQPRQQ